MNGVLYMYTGQAVQALEVTEGKDFITVLVGQIC